MQIPKSSYYYQQKHSFDKIMKDKDLLRLIEAIFYAKRQKAGIRTIAMILRNKYGVVANLKKIARIKKQYGLITKVRKKIHIMYCLRKVWNIGRLLTC